ncbi:hypothetical protein G6F57_015030 [Rhizopus arrhizus]|nr:hypothetical protein G6F57_015030 [Rhizopus arrhizus]
MGQRARCKGRGIRMRAQIGTGGDIAGQCCEAAWAVAERLGLLAQAQRDLAEEQGQAGKQRCLQQRWPGRGTFQQRLQQRERANATGQPYRQAIAVAEQHAQQYRDRQCRRQADHRAQQCQLQRQQQRQAIAREAVTRLWAGQPDGRQHGGRSQRGTRHVGPTQGQNQASHGQRRAADQQSAISTAGELLQMRQPGGIGGAGGCSGHRRLLDQQTAAATPRRTHERVAWAWTGNSGNATSSTPRRQRAVTPSCG